MNLPVLDVTDWLTPDDVMFPPGARDKQILISPPEGDEFRNNRYYMFKESVNRHPEQFWCEVIAYHIGKMVHVEVPKAYPAALDSKNGALIEWFFEISDYGIFRKKHLIHGSDYMKMRHEDYDIDKGRQHNFEDIATISEDLRRNGLLEKNWLKYWIKVLCFDVIIGNTDRHHSNWGVIVSAKNKCHFTPAYDNGTALGYEIIERNIKKFNESNYLYRYIEKGQHHMKWSRNDDFSKVKGEKHFEILIKLCDKYQQAKKYILEMLPNSGKLNNLKKILHNYSQYHIDIPLTEERYELIFKLVETRCMLIKNKIENC